MITSTKNCRKKKKDTQNPRTDGKSKGIQTKSHKKHTHTHSQKEKKEKIYICFKKKEEESNQINKQIYN